MVSNLSKSNVNLAGSTGYFFTELPLHRYKTFFCDIAIASRPV